MAVKPSLLPTTAVINPRSKDVFFFFSHPTVCASRGIAQKQDKVLSQDFVVIVAEF